MFPLHCPSQERYQTARHHSHARDQSSDAKMSAPQTQPFVAVQIAVAEGNPELKRRAWSTSKTEKHS